MKKDRIKDATKEKGALHKALGVSIDKNIPSKKLNKALHSKDVKIRKEATWIIRLITLAQAAFRWLPIDSRYFAS